MFKHLDDDDGPPDEPLAPDEEWKKDVMVGWIKVKKRPPADPKKDPRTSMGRFHMRIAKFQEKYRRFPRIIHHFWWLVHNIPAHIAIALVPVEATFRFHDWTSKKLNAQ